jgi:uncharacterized protein with HEPN domain
VPIFIDASALIIMIEIRTLRNKLVHEYMDSAPDLLQALIVALKSSEALTQTQKDLAQYVGSSLVILGWDAQNKLSQK